MTASPLAAAMRTASLPMLVLALAATACLRAPPGRTAPRGFDARTPCAQLAVAWRDYDARPVSRATYWRSARAFVDRALTCHDPELVFAGSMIGPACRDDRACATADGGRLTRLERAGVPLKAAFAAWLTARDLGPLGASIAYCPHEPYRSLRETTRWLVRAGYREFARPLAALALTQRDPYVQATLLEYFVAFDLPEGEPLARRLLTHADPTLRARACAAIARLGSSAALSEVRAVAAADAHSRLVRVDGIEQEVYPVRAQCAAAVDALTTRSSVAAVR